MVYDADGVLIDSTRKGIERHIIFAQKKGLPIPSIDTIRQHWGREWKKDFLPRLIRTMNWPDWTLKAMIEFVQENPEEYPPIDGLPNMLTTLHDNKCQQAIVSNRKTSQIITLLDKAGIKRDVFEFIQGPDLPPCVKKPDPGVFAPTMALARKHGIAHDQIFYIGDTLAYDWLATQNNEPPIKFIGIVSGAQTREEFAQHLAPEFILDSVTQLPTIIL